MISLDHAAWFHRPARADEWLLQDVQSLVNAGGRGTLRGVIRDTAGPDRRLDGAGDAPSARHALICIPGRSRPWRRVGHGPCRRSCSLPSRSPPSTTTWRPRPAAWASPGRRRSVRRRRPTRSCVPGSRPGWRWLPHRTQVGRRRRRHHRRHALPGLQRCGGRAGHLQGPGAAAGEPVPVRRGDDHRRLRRRCAGGVHLRQGELRARDGRGDPRRRRRCSPPGSAPTARSPSSPGPTSTSSARRRRCSR